MKKRSIILFTIVIAVINIFSNFAMAQNNTKWAYQNGTLTISGTGAMQDYTAQDTVPWSKYKGEIKKVVIDYGITSIGDWSFADCEKMEKLSISDSVIRIGKRAFYNCSGLGELNVGYGTKYIGDGAFNSCTNVTKVKFYDSLISIGDSSFMNMQKLGAVIIPASVKNIGNRAFFENSNMKGLYFEGSVVEKIGSQIIVGIDDDYTVFYNRKYASDWIEEEIFDEMHAVVYDASSFIPVYINNTLVCSDYNAITTNSRVLIPVRVIFEMMGVTVEWNAQTKSVSTKKGDINVEIPINSNIIYRNGNAITIDAPAIVQNQVTYIPVRAVTQAYGAAISWNQSEKSVNITY